MTLGQWRGTRGDFARSILDTEAYRAVVAEAQAAAEAAAEEGEEAGGPDPAVLYDLTARREAALVLLRKAGHDGDADRARTALAAGAGRLP